MHVDKLNVGRYLLRMGRLKVCRYLSLSFATAFLLILSAEKHSLGDYPFKQYSMEP